MCGKKLPQASAYILYEHMMIPGINELYYKSAQNDPGIMLSKIHRRPANAPRRS